MLKLSVQKQSDLESAKLEAVLEQAARQASAAMGMEGFDCSAMPSKEKGADFQINGAFKYAKQNGRKPMDCAAMLCDALNERLAGIAKAEVSAPGFVNLRFGLWYLENRLQNENAGELWPDLSQERILVDYSSPNCAKKMHVGHLRSTVIGDALCGIYGKCGARVERVNHVGDFGTPFGIILEQFKAMGRDPCCADLDEIEAAYKEGAARFKQDPGFAEACRAATAKIQAGQEPEAGQWRKLREASMESMQEAYNKLGVGLDAQCVRGESSYQAELPGVLRELEDKGVARLSDGALCYFPDSGQAPLLLAKSEQAGSGALYGATDAAALRLRCGQGHTQLLYVVDGRQSEHFEAVFGLGRKAGWLGDGTNAAHVKFGMLLDKDGRPFKTRSGQAFLLDDLLDLAYGTAQEANADRLGAMSGAEASEFVWQLAAGALKYADLSRPRAGDVKFDAKAICSLTGNTSAYLQYVGARAHSIVAKSEGLPVADLAPGDIGEAQQEAQRKLALELCRLPGALADAAQQCAPHHATDALYRIGQAFGTFYEKCPALAACGEGEGKAADRLRLMLCRQTAHKVAEVLSALGIAAPKAMPKAKPKAVV